MTKELVKSENGHKFVKHARDDEGTHAATLSRPSSSAWIKMGFAIVTPFVVIFVFFALASGDSTIAPDRNASSEDYDLIPASAETSDKAPTTSRPGKVSENDANDFTSDNILEEILLFESLMDEGDKAVNDTDDDDDVDKDESARNDAIDTSENPVQSKTTFGDVRRQGDLNPEFEEKQTSGPPDAPRTESSRGGQPLQYGLRSQSIDVSKQDAPTDQSTQYSSRPRNPKRTGHDGVPVLQLIEGGYQRPFTQPLGFRNRPLSRTDSSEQSEEVRELDRGGNANRQRSPQRIVPQVTYTAPAETSYPFGQGPVLRQTFQVPQRMLVNRNPSMRVMPTAVQNGFLNTPPAGFTDYTTTTFQAPFPFSNDVGGFGGFASDPNSGAIYHTPQRIPFQNLLYQVPSATPILVDSPRNFQSQFSPSSYSSYPNLDNTEDQSRPNFGPYSRNPPPRPQYQVPSNFFGTNANHGGNAFNGPPLNYPTPTERLPAQFYRHPVTEGARYQDVQSDQQPASDASQEDKKPKETQPKERNSDNRDTQSQSRFGSRLQRQNDGDVYIKYPTNEAGYAVEENLPPQNSTRKVADDVQQADPRQRSQPDRDPYRNALNSIRNHRRPNNPRLSASEELFRGPPIDFGYQRPQAQPFLQYSDRNRDLPPFLSSAPNFDSRSSFNQIAPFPESPFLNAGNQRRTNRDYDETITPTCAKKDNASICFEDGEYPRNDILFSFNLDTLGLSRLTGPFVLNPNTLVDQQQNSTSDAPKASEKYACEAAISYGSPLRAKNMVGAWRIIVHVREKFTQPIRTEVCRSAGDPCSYSDSKTKSACVQKYSLQRLLSWDPDKGLFMDVFKIPVACSCRILEVVEV